MIDLTWLHTHTHTYTHTHTHTHTQFSKWSLWSTYLRFCVNFDIVSKACPRFRCYGLLEIRMHLDSPFITSLLCSAASSPWYDLSGWLGFKTNYLSSYLPLQIRRLIAWFLTLQTSWRHNVAQAVSEQPELRITYQSALRLRKSCHPGILIQTRRHSDDKG